MSSDLDFMWSNTDFPYACLVDEKRTNAFREAVERVVKPGDVVVEVGAGTGILSLLAAKAGARKVYAVEIDPLLAQTLRETVKANSYEAIIDVIEGDALNVDLPMQANVVIAELIETGLLDEMQVPVINALHEKGIIGSNTKVIPQSYETYIELVSADDSFYGFTIKAPKHMWPAYDSEVGWLRKKVLAVSSRETLCHVDFGSITNPELSKVINFDIQEAGPIPNAIRLSGKIVLAEGVVLEDTDTINGKKVLALPFIYAKNTKHEVTAGMGKGLGSLKIRAM